MRRGLTLLEVLLGNFMLMIVVLAAFSLLAGTLRLGESSEKALQAETYAQSALERVRDRPPEEIATGAIAASVYGDFTVRGEVKEVTGFDPDQLKQVEVEVRWSNKVLRRSVRVCGLEDR